MHSTIWIILILTLIFPGFASAEQLQLNTYYPAPSGSYDRMILAPQPDKAPPCIFGTLYLKLSDASLYLCNNVSQWTVVGGSASTWTKAGNNIYPAGTAGNPNIKVGIQTTAPSEPLHVVGSIMLSGVNSNALYLTDASHQITNNATGLYFYQNTPGQDITLLNENASGNIIFKTNGTERMRIHALGNVGIGNTADTAALLVKTGVSGGQTGYFAAYNPGPGAPCGNAYSYAAVSLNGLTDCANYNFRSTWSLTKDLDINHPFGSNLSFRENDNEQMYIDNAGNVNISGSLTVVGVGSGLVIPGNGLGNPPGNYVLTSTGVGTGKAQWANNASYYAP